MKKKPLSKRAKGRLQKLRRSPFGRFGLALEAYLATIGWSVVVVGSPAILGENIGRVGNWTFTVQFTGARPETAAAPVPDTRAD